MQNLNEKLAYRADFAYDFRVAKGRLLAPQGREPRGFERFKGSQREPSSKPLWTPTTRVAKQPEYGVLNS